jgi:hydrogenase/urease accessory protein HupE
MKRKILFGLLFGVLAGVLDVIPMWIKELPLEADISAFIMWVVCGFILSITEIKMPAVLRGILISFLLLSPCAILIGWKEPMSLTPVFIMTLIIGGPLGFAISKVK